MPRPDAIMETVVRIGQLMERERYFREAPLSVGSIAVTQGVSKEVIVGMLGMGMPLGTIVDALAEHGDLPDLGAESEQRSEIRFVQVDGSWTISS